MDGSAGGMLDLSAGSVGMSLDKPCVNYLKLRIHPFSLSTHT